MMNILCDVHIAFKIAKWFSRKGCNAIHVNMILNKSETTDAEICRYADENNFIVITKDADFKSSFFILNTPRKLIKVNLGNVSNTTLIELFEKIIRLLKKLRIEKDFTLRWIRTIQVLMSLKNSVYLNKLYLLKYYES